METQTEILDIDIAQHPGDGQVEQIISLNKFMILSIFTFGIYTVWWSYKAWRFYKEKEKADITPALRAIFGIFYFYSLVKQILHDARHRDYPESYAPGWLFAGFIAASIVSKAPEPYWLFSFFNIACFVPPFKAFNYLKQNSTGIIAVEQSSFTNRQLVLLITGVILWALVIYGLII